MVCPCNWLLLTMHVLVVSFYFLQQINASCYPLCVFCYYFRTCLFRFPLKSLTFRLIFQLRSFIFNCCPWCRRDIHFIHPYWFSCSPRGICFIDVLLKLRITRIMCVYCSYANKEIILFFLCHVMIPCSWFEHGINCPEERAITNILRQQVLCCEWLSPLLHCFIFVLGGYPCCSRLIFDDIHNDVCQPHGIVTSEDKTHWQTHWWTRTSGNKFLGIRFILEVRRI